MFYSDPGQVGANQQKTELRSLFEIKSPFKGDNAF
jgi:hypothetical protein